jgi:hypothetical protein
VLQADWRQGCESVAVCSEAVSGSVQRGSEIGQCADRLRDSASMRLLLASGADVDRLNRVGERPLGYIDVLKEFRGTPRHDIVRSNRAKFRFEKDAIYIDDRYKNTMAKI